MTIPKPFTARSSSGPRLQAPDRLARDRRGHVCSLVGGIMGPLSRRKASSPGVKGSFSANIKGITRRPLDAGSKDPARNPGSVVQGGAKKPLDSASPKLNLTPKQRYQN